MDSTHMPLHTVQTVMKNEKRPVRRTILSTVMSTVMSTEMSKVMNTEW
jgi:hypothetical protein